MLITCVVVWIFSVGLMVLGVGVVSGQEYPNKPIRIVTGGAGGGSDFLARLIGRGVSGALGQPVIVDNRGGAIASGEAASKAPPDGYTLLVTAHTLWIGPLLQKMPYDPVMDFSPITLVNKEPNVLVVHPSLPVKSVKELIALAKARPGELNYGSTSSGTSNHLAAELFKTMAGVNIVRVPYKASGPLAMGVVGGEVHLTFGGAASLAPHIKSGRLTALAVTSSELSALFPGLPTIAASVPGYESISINAVFAPARTPATIISRLNQEIVRVLNTLDVKEKLLNAGVEVVGSSPEQLAATMKADIARMGKVIKDAGIRGE